MATLRQRCQLTCAESMGYFVLVSSSMPRLNSLTIDVEDWYHVCGLAKEPVVRQSEWRVEQNIDRLLSLLARHGVKATFFVLGCVAESIPSLVPRISAEGHEIASHGFSHRLVYTLTEDEFREEIRRTGSIISSQSGEPPVGFRAPQWSLSRRRTPWAFDILAQEGYLYDSSCTPLPFIGEPGGDISPHKLGTLNGPLWEIPPLVTAAPLINLPTGGGWGLRIFPMWLIERSVKLANIKGDPAVFYLHPREMEADGPRLGLSAIASFAAYGPRSDVTSRVEQLLERYQFTTLRNLVKTWQ